MAAPKVLTAALNTAPYLKEHSSRPSLALSVCFDAWSLSAKGDARSPDPHDVASRGDIVERISTNHDEIRAPADNNPPTIR